MEEILNPLNFVSLGSFILLVLLISSMISYYIISSSKYAFCNNSFCASFSEELTQLATRAVCIIWTALKRPRSFNTTVRARYQGKPTGLMQDRVYFLVLRVYMVTLCEYDYIFKFFLLLIVFVLTIFFPSSSK